MYYVKMCNSFEKKQLNLYGDRKVFRFYLNMRKECILDMYTINNKLDPWAWSSVQLPQTNWLLIIIDHQSITCSGRTISMENHCIFMAKVSFNLAEFNLSPANIVSGCNSPTDRILGLLDHFIPSLVPPLKSHIKDTLEKYQWFLKTRW